jgi:hypothetical protein
MHVAAVLDRGDGDYTLLVVDLVEDPVGASPG